MSRSVSEVSIITVNWNGKEHLRALLPSLTPLSAREIIVVDNGSTDGSLEFLRSQYPQVRVLRNEVNKGFCQPNNWAAREAKGSILALINNDMRADSNWLEAGVAGLEHADCTASRILDWEGERIDFNGSSLQYLGYALQQDIGKLVEQVSHSDRILFPCGGAMLIDREVFLRVGGFDSDFFAIYEDVDLGWRLWVTGHEIRFSPASKVFHRGHATFQTQHQAKMRFLMHRNALLTILKNYDEELVRKIFPLALVSAVRRAVRSSGVVKESFYLWEGARAGLQAGDPASLLQMLDSMNHLVSIEDTLRLLPRMLVKRRHIQQMRRRQDSEILELFVDPLRQIVEDPDYCASELDYLRYLDLDSWFKSAAYEERLSELADPLPLHMQNLRRELKALQWVGNYATLHPPNPGAPSKSKKFWLTCKEHGVRPALRLVREAFRRAF